MVKGVALGELKRGLASHFLLSKGYRRNPPELK